MTHNTGDGQMDERVEESGDVPAQPIRIIIRSEGVVVNQPPQKDVGDGQ